jgi:hypothetical protein
MLPLVVSSGSRVLCCQLVILERFKLTRVFVIVSDMSDSCLLQSFSCNSIFIMLYLDRERVVDYLVVDEMINISNIV